MAKSTATANDLTSDATELAYEAQDVALNAVREQPITAIVIAIIFGILIGKLVL